MKPETLKNNGFTLIELLTVILVIAIVSSAVFWSKRTAEQNKILEAAAFQLAQDIREMEEMALGAKAGDCGGTPKREFGIYLEESSPTQYILFVDCYSPPGNEHRYKPGNPDNDVVLRTVNLASAVQIADVQRSSDNPNELSAVFVPPEPTVYINNDEIGETATITLCLAADCANQTRDVIVNTVGMIEVQ